MLGLVTLDTLLVTHSYIQLVLNISVKNLIIFVHIDYVSIFTSFISIKYVGKLKMNSKE